MTVIDASKIFADKAIYNQLGWLSSLVKKHETMICANPMKYFNEAVEEIHRLRGLLDKVKDASDLERPTMHRDSSVAPQRPRDIRDESFDKITKVRDIIWSEYK